MFRNFDLCVCMRFFSLSDIQQQYQYCFKCGKYDIWSATVIIILRIYEEQMQTQIA